LRQRIAEFGLAGKPIETFFDLLDFDEGRDPVRARSWELRPAMILMLMGVAGSGKTTIGRLLASELRWRFNDADDFHPPANITKMSAGIPLNDADRAPWLQAIRGHVLTCLHNAESAVVTCSALKKTYRDVIVPDPARVKLVYLKGPRDLLLSRLSARESHFMKPQMLESQLATLEEPENALTVDVSRTPAEIVAEIRKAFSI
jgi:gluconokinase